MGKVHRQIKYKFYDRGTNTINQVIEINLKNRDLLVEIDGMYVQADFKDGELLEFTGQLDTNGEEIYEEDLVKLTLGGESLIEKVWWNSDGWAVGGFGGPLSGFMLTRMGNRLVKPVEREVQSVTI